MGRIRPWLVGAVALFGAIVTSVVLYRKTRLADVGDRAEIMSSVRELQRWSALVSRETLAARYGLVPYYDSLTRANGEQARTAERLNADLHEVARTHPALAQNLDDLLRTVSERNQDVEHFKSQNSILRNSLYYLPLAAREFLRRLALEPSDHEEEIGRA